MRLIKFIFYSLLRILEELIGLCWTALNAIEFRTFGVYLGCLLIGASSILIHTVARQQNQNYIEIMNHSLEESNSIFNANSWNSEDNMTDFLLNQLRFGFEETLQIEDTISRSHMKSPTWNSYLYLLSEINPEVEEEMLKDMYNKKDDCLDNYLYSRYIRSAMQEIKDEDYYAANKLISRYFRLHDQFYGGSPLDTGHNYYYLSRLLLQDRWALSCNRETAKELFVRTKNIANNVMSNLPLSAVSMSSYATSFRDYVAYLKGVELIQSKSYSIALDYFKGLYDSTSSDLFKEHICFMIVRSAFWIYENDRTVDNKRVFIDIIQKYSPNIKSNSLKIDVDYYKNIVISI